MSHSFQVDLRGIVDLLSHHLYGSPRVYVRELLQNATDAITARRAEQPTAPASIWFETAKQTPDGTLRVHDTGIGLTEQQVHDLLATIGRSGKRDELGFSRQEFLGQFGIGLLSCFLVADEIRVQTRQAGSPTVYFTGYADGRYTVSTALSAPDRDGATPGGGAIRDRAHDAIRDRAHDASDSGSRTIGDGAVIEGPTGDSIPDRAQAPQEGGPQAPREAQAPSESGPQMPREAQAPSETRESPESPQGPPAPMGARVDGPREADGRAENRDSRPERAEVGTTVTLVPRRDTAEWFDGLRVTELAKLFGEMLPVPVRVDGELITVGAPPWQLPKHDLPKYAEETFGFTPFDTIELSVPEAGLTGVAFVLPHPANPAAKAGHRVYLKRMLLAEGAEGLLPEWAFFARCTIDATELRPTASREALYADGLLDSVREQLGEKLRGWLMALARKEPHRLQQFLSVHHLGVKTLALHDLEMLRLVDEWWPVETNMGPMPLAEFRQRFTTVRYCATIDEFRQLAAVAAAQDLAVVNAGYTYDAEIIERLPLLDPTIMVDRLDPSDLSTRFDTLDPATELALRPFLTVAQRRMDPLGCEVVLRSFDPPGLAALYLVDREATFQRRLRETQEVVDEVWAGVLAAFERAEAATRPQLVLNHRNPLVRRITALPNDELAGLAVESLYGQALLLGHHPLRPADSALLNRSFLGLLQQAVPGYPGEAGFSEEGGAR